MITKKAAKKLNDTAIELKRLETEVLDRAVKVYRKGNQRCRSRYDSLDHAEEAFRILNEYEISLSELRRSTRALVKARKEYDLVRTRR